MDSLKFRAKSVKQTLILRHLLLRLRAKADRRDSETSSVDSYECLFKRGINIKDHIDNLEQQVDDQRRQICSLFREIEDLKACVKGLDLKNKKLERRLGKFVKAIMEIQGFW